MRLLFFKFCFLLPWIICAQSPELTPCEEPSASAEIDANNIRALLLNGGDLFWDFDRGRFIPGSNAIDEPNTIFAAALWLGGIDPGGNLKLAAQDYRPSGRNDYWPGPLDSTGLAFWPLCDEWNRIFKITASEISAFSAALPLTAAEAIAAYPNVMGWPATGNPYFDDVYGFELPTGQPLAPFADANGDGLYDPFDGDSPAVELAGQAPFVPTQLLWTVFNDEGGGQPHARTGGDVIQAEVQLTAWAFHASGDPVLHNTVFTQHKIFNRAVEFIDSLSIGLWVDFDLGCPYDDYIGSLPDLSTFFVYNQDGVDGQPGVTCDGTPTFGDNPPTQSVTFLNAPLDHFTYYHNPTQGAHPAGTTDPNQPEQFYNYLTGRWRDGTPMYEGGSGYQSGTVVVDHAFAGDPADPAAWTMCSANLPYGDRRVVASHQAGLLSPGAATELVAAWIHHPQLDYQPCSLGDLTTNVQIIQDLYEAGFSTIVSAPAPTPMAPTFTLAPNPAAARVQVSYGEQAAHTLRIFSVDGRLVCQQSGLPAGRFEFSVESLQAGVYTVELATSAGIGRQKLVVVR